MNVFWIDSTGEVDVGGVGFLTEAHAAGSEARTTLSTRVGRRNRSGAPILKGWMGETNNVSRYARGVARVIALNAAGDRAKVATLDGAELASALEELGYPDLAPAEGAK